MGFYRKLSIVLVILILVWSSGFLEIRNVLAQTLVCTANVDVTEVYPGTIEPEFYFNVYNTGSDPIVYIKVTTPNAAINPVTVNLGGWDVSSSGNSSVIKDSVMYSGGDVGFGIIVAEVPTSLNGFSGNWSVQVSTNSNGSGLVNCGGQLSLNVSQSAPDNVAPQISSVTISDISSSSVKINWNTNEGATSWVYYDFVPDADPFALNSGSNDLISSHSITLSQGIAPSTTYYYKICSADLNGNEACTAEASFTSGAFSTPSPQIVTQTVTTQTTVTQIIKPAVDSLGPTLSFDVDKSESSYQISPQFSGVADDKSKVVRVDYSVDDGKNWLPTDTEDLGEARVRFGFRPEIFDDGTYLIRTRAMDSQANVTVSPSKKIVIDRLPPLVGGGIFTFGAFLLSQNSDSNLVMAKEIEYSVIVSAVGGPEEIVLSIDDRDFPMQKFGVAGLWKGSIRMENSGVFDIVANAVDGALNETSRGLGSIQVVSSGKVSSISDGKVLEDVQISFFVKDLLTNNWTLWSGDDFGQKNPIFSDSNGEYHTFLPAGTYYFVIKKDGYKTITSKVFEIDRPAVFNQQFKLTKSGYTNFLIEWIGGFRPSNLIDPVVAVSGFDNDSKLVGKEAFAFDLPGKNGRVDLHAKRGKPIFVSFVNTWSPGTIEQLSVLSQIDENINKLVVFELETLSKASVFMGRGKYDFEFAVDVDGVLVDDYEVSVYPTSMILDRGGVVRKVFSGVVGVGEIESEILNASVF